MLSVRAVLRNNNNKCTEKKVQSVHDQQDLQQDHDSVADHPKVKQNLQVVPA